MQLAAFPSRVAAFTYRLVQFATSVSVFFVSAVLVGEVHAATKTWTGTSGALWSSAANWSPAGAPVNGDALLFPSAATTRVTTNDINNLTLAELEFGASGYTITGNALTIAGPYKTTGGNTITAPLTLVGTGLTVSNDKFSDINTTNASPISFLGTDHTGTFNAGAGDVNFSNALLFGPLTGSGRINPNGSGSLNYTGSGAFSGTIGGMLNLGGAELRAATLVGGDLSGNGAIGTVRDATFIRPRQLNANNRGRNPTSTGTLNIATAEGGNYSISLNGPLAGTNYSQVVISNKVTLGGDLYLGMDVNFFPRQGDRFTIINNTGSLPVSGTFKSLDEGAIFPFD